MAETKRWEDADTTSAGELPVAGGGFADRTKPEAILPSERAALRAFHGQWRDG
jgi:hypothetical protein